MQDTGQARTGRAPSDDRAAVSDAVRQSWAAHHVSPLWENRAAPRKDADARDRGHFRGWTDLNPLTAAAIGIRSMEAVERGVLSLISPPTPVVGTSAGTTRNLNAGLQILMPGEAARPHRHSMNAL